MNIFDLIESLKLTTKKKEKEKLLESVKRDDIIKTFLRYTYDPNILSNMKKIEVKQVGNKDFYEMFTSFIKLYDSLSRRDITGNTAKNAVRFFLEKCNEQTQKLFINSLKKDLKCGISVKTLNNVFGNNFIEYFEVQLANKYKPEKHNIKEFFISPKLDGLRCYYDTKIGKLLTRAGKPIIGFEHITKELNLLAKKFKIKIFDGELYSENLDFHTIQGYVTRCKNINTEHKKQIRFYCFAVISDYIKNTEQMVEVIDNFNLISLQYIKPVKQFKINSKEEVEKFHKEFVEQGFEGAMLRHPQNYYSYGRSNDLLKVKMFKENDFECVDIEIGPFRVRTNGKEEIIETVTAIYVEGIVDKKEIKSKVGTGFSLSMRNEIYENQEFYKGKKVEIKYFEITPDNSLRFPVFMKWKLDRK